MPQVGAGENIGVLFTLKTQWLELEKLMELDNRANLVEIS